MIRLQSYYQQVACHNVQVCFGHIIQTEIQIVFSKS